jgi:hypothetical protein
MLDFHGAHILTPHKILPQDEKLASTILRQCDQFFLDDDGLLYHL